MGKYYGIFLLLCVVCSAELSAQGCSDAGACSIYGDHTGADTSTYHQIAVGMSSGKADNDIIAWGQYLEYQWRASDVLGVSAKMTSLAQSGNGLSVFGLGDIYLTSAIAVADDITVTIGGKFPLTDGNRLDNGNALPMDYQSSLGTIDILAGMTYRWDNMRFALALQQPLTQNNNQFLAANSTQLQNFPSTRNFIRSGDIVGRVSYGISLADSWRLTPSIVPIYHLANDRFTDIAGKEFEIEGSQGLTLNGNIFLDYTIRQGHSLQLNIAMPFVVRKARPDGLTRSFLAGIEYRIAF